MRNMAHVFGMSVSSLMLHMSPTENMPNLLEETGKWLTALPMVFDWMRRSAFRRGAATALSLGLAHFPEDFVLDEITNGYLAPDGQSPGARSRRCISGQRPTRSRF